MSNLYEILKVSRQASRKEIKEAYYILSKKVHPDLTHSKNSQDFVEISKAYSVLSNPESRRNYDLTLKESRVRYNTRSRLDPNDFKLYKKNRGGSFNHHEWNSQHYPFNVKRTSNVKMEFWTRQQYQEKRKSPSIFAYTGLVMIAVFFVNSGWVELLYL